VCARASVSSSSAPITSTFNSFVLTASARLTSQYAQSKLQCLFGFMFTPMDNPRARGETTAYTKRLLKNSRGQPNAVARGESPGGLDTGARFSRSLEGMGFDSPAIGDSSVCIDIHILPARGKHSTEVGDSFAFIAGPSSSITASVRRAADQVRVGKSKRRAQRHGLT